MLDLYETFYKLTADPFRLSPDHRFVLDHDSYVKSRSYLEYALHRGEGFIVITGGAGTGKTTLISEILAKLDKTQIQVATLNSTQLEARDLLHMVASSFGLPLRAVDKAAILLELEEFLKQQGKKGRRAVLIVDEAQGLSQSALEELRLLANLQFNNRLLLQVFLVGQETLRDLLDRPDMDHLRQRIVAASHLYPLNPDETVDYVEHRLNRVGWKGDPKIDAEALMLIHNFSGGIPRKINLICSRLFLFGAMEKKHELVGADAKSVIGDLQQEHLMSSMAVQGSSAAAAVSRIGAQDEGFTTAFVHSLPRKTSSPDRPRSVAQTRSAEQRSEKVEEDADLQEAGTGTSEAKDTWTEIEELKQELRDSCEDIENLEASIEQPEPSNEATVQATNTPVENTTPPVGTVEPAPVENLMAVEARHIPRTRTSKQSHWQKSAITAVVILALLVVGLIAMFDFRTDNAVRTTAAIDEKIVVEQKGTVQRDTQFTESLDESSRESGPTQEAGVPEQPVMVDSVPERPQSEVEPDTKSTLPPDSEVPVATEPEIEPVIRSSTPFDSKVPLTTESDTASVGIRSPARQVTVDVASPETLTAPATTAAAIDKKDDTREEGVTASTSSIEAQRARLRAEAEERLNQRLSERKTAVKKNSKRAPVSGAQPTVAVKPGIPALKQPAKKIQPLSARLPDQNTKVVPPVPATAPQRKPVSSIPAPGRIQSMLLAGYWTSQNKPATLLPSEITQCQQKGESITCFSIPQSVSTRYGLATYKVEATLQDFTATGEFQLSYRTLVRLVEADSPNNTGSGNDREQVSEHSMTCQLTQLSRILCQDEKGTKREYRQL
ncbi:putative secretion ATPase (PEP-CTERM system associated) [Thiogranum longum]|uniref:Putative secretion ATPase (PEP-CTERM system associated) n=1 Tax=Thiogranum longum TaxID=1537524 RepID=A0A4R1HD41_9GAMM|nr:AAA family ATPase [Thiogranum longum]TCK18195.1 putative secretion ATPase (PEP-CTERM system associated) [Thiogranum longum]